MIHYTISVQDWVGSVEEKKKHYFQFKDQSLGNQYQFTLKTQRAARIYQIIANTQLDEIDSCYYFNQDWQAD